MAQLPDENRPFAAFRKPSRPWQVTAVCLAGALWGLWRIRPWAFWALPLAMAVDDAIVWAMGELALGVVIAQTGVVLLVLLFRPRGSGWL